MIKFTIELKPISKKNSQQIVRPNGMNRPIVIPSKAYKTYEAQAVRFMPATFINAPCNVKAVFYMPTKHKCDLVNMQEALLDAMIKGGVICDDNYTIVRSMDGSRVEYDKEHPRTEVEITLYSEVFNNDAE